MNIPLLSIIVPVYNVEFYLENCLKSILSQSFTDFELILVNDGSKDNSGLICEKYANIDNRIILIEKNNGGLSSARNAGLKIAKGKYITFVDSDDELAPETYLPNMTILLNDTTIDVLQFPTVFFYNTDKAYKQISNSQIIESIDILRNWYRNRPINYSACNKIYKRGVFSNIKYPEGKVFEDFYIVPDIITKIKRFYISEFGEYRYFERKNSILTSGLSLDKMEDLLEAKKKMYDLLYNNRHHLKKETIISYISMLKTFIDIADNGSFKYNKNNSLSDKIPYDILIKSGLPIKNKLFVFFVKILGVNLFVNLYLKIR